MTCLVCAQDAYDELNDKYQTENFNFRTLVDTKYKPLKDANQANVAKIAELRLQLRQVTEQQQQAVVAACSQATAAASAQVQSLRAMVAQV